MRLPDDTEQRAERGTFASLFLRKVAGVFVDAFDEVRETIEFWLERQALDRELRELGQLDSWQVERSLRDSGADPASLSVLVEGHPHVQRLFPRMLERLGIGREQARRNARLMRELQLACGTCPNPRKCRRWLRSGKPSEAYRAFCPNASALEELHRRLAEPGT